jgi:hypothetical protein
MRPLLVVTLIGCAAISACGTGSPPRTSVQASAPSGGATTKATNDPSPPSETFSISAATANIDGSLSISGSIVSVRVETNFPAFKSGYFTAVVLVSTPESAAIPLPKCPGHEGACRLESNVLADTLDCDGLCHPGDYTISISVFSHGDPARLEQSASYLAWVGGESGANLRGSVLALDDPQHPGSLYLRKVVSLHRSSY